MRQDEIKTTVDIYGIHANEFSQVTQTGSVQPNTGKFHCIARAYTDECDQRRCRSCLENYLDAVMKGCF